VLQPRSNLSDPAAGNGGGKQRGGGRGGSERGGAGFARAWQGRPLVFPPPRVAQLERLLALLRGSKWGWSGYNWNCSEMINAGTTTCWQLFSCNDKRGWALAHGLRAAPRRGARRGVGVVGGGAVDSLAGHSAGGGVGMVPRAMWGLGSLNLMNLSKKPKAVKFTMKSQAEQARQVEAEIDAARSFPNANLSVADAVWKLSKAGTHEWCSSTSRHRMPCNSRHEGSTCV